jgi:hypothetical protein
MGLFDDITGFLDDVRQMGDELGELKDDVISTVTDFGSDLAEPVTELSDVLGSESAEE